MNIKTLLNKKILGSALIIGAFILFGASAYSQTLSPSDVIFPIAELDNCGSKVECKTWCEGTGAITDTEIKERHARCEAFAEKYGLGGARERKERFEHIGPGPDGTCGLKPNPRMACEAVCNIAENMERCLAWALENNFVSGENERIEMTKVLSALRRGIRPPCANEADCEQKCKHPSNTAEARACFEFAREAGLLPPEIDATRTDKMLELIERGDIHFEKAQMCEHPENLSDEDLDACIAIGIKLGILKPEEADIARTVIRTGGPGGCRGEACKTYCEDENHAEECIAFAEQHGLLSEDNHRLMEEEKKGFKNALEQAPPELRACLEEKIGKGTVEELINGTKPLSERLEPVMHECFMRININNGYGEKTENTIPRPEFTPEEMERMRIRSQIPPEPETVFPILPLPNDVLYIKPPQSRYNPPTLLGFFSHLILNIR